MDVFFQPTEYGRSRRIGGGEGCGGGASLTREAESIRQTGGIRQGPMRAAGRGL